MRSQVADAQLSGEEAQGVESQTFWCFARLMERMEPNFSTDCTWVDCYSFFLLVTPSCAGGDLFCSLG